MPRPAPNRALTAPEPISMVKVTVLFPLSWFWRLDDFTLEVWGECIEVEAWIGDGPVT
jgi:hypothetical protein